ncbi:unnamed protein product, partial [Schistosoma turkestanicum]
FGFQSQLSTDCNKIPDNNKDNKFSSEFLSSINSSQQLHPCNNKSCSSTYSCSHCHCYDHSTTTCYTSNNSTPSKPIFIDPTDFQTHQPTQSSVTFPSYHYYFPLNTKSTNIPTLHANSISDRRNTYCQSSQALYNQNISSSVSTTKDFKWLRRNKPLKIFGHRFSLETQPHSSSPTTTPASITPQTAPPSDSFLSSFITPKKFMSPVDNCNSTVLSKSNLSGNNYLSTSMHFETQQLPITRQQSSIRHMTGCSLFVNNSGNNTLKSIFFNNNNSTKTKATNTIVSSSSRPQ